MISQRFFWICLLALLAVYGIGLPTTVMENDSAQFAVMAMRMVQENDFWSLWKGTEEYLDKPHLHYWLAAFSYTLFGITDWAYRLPAVLLTLVGAWSVHGLGRLLYTRQAGRIAALVFMSAQTIVLSVIDVRTDAVLTGFAAFSLWQLTRYLQQNKRDGLLWGAIGAGLAFSTKGQIALLVIGLPVFCQLLSAKRWERLFSPHVLWALVVFFLVISPVLYAYYLQFDLHPEKVIRGRDHRSGVLFILWEQSFERLSGEGVGKNSSDYFFFFHTFLWVFLPWTLMGLAAFGQRARQAWPTRKTPGAIQGEWLTIGGITLIFLLISFAQFKLPHYLNITIPLFAILTGGFLDQKYREGHLRWLKRAAHFQAGILGIFLLAIGGILFWVFPISAGLAAGILLAAATAAFVLYRWVPSPLVRLVGLGVLASVALNGVMNGHFYPSLLRYQAGSEAARVLRAESPETARIYKLDAAHTWALDFYFGNPVIQTDWKSLEMAEEPLWLYLDDAQMEALEQHGWVPDKTIALDQFRISRLQGRFLNPTTRVEVLRHRYLVQVTPR